MEDYFIKDVLIIPWPTTIEKIYIEAVKSTYKWFVLVDKDKKIVGCVRRETLANKLNQVKFSNINLIPLDSIFTDFFVNMEDRFNPINYNNSKIVVIQDDKGLVKGVIDWEFDQNISKTIEEDKWLIREMRTVFDAFYESIFVTDEKGNVLRVTSKDDQDHLGKNIYDLERERVFYPSISAKVLKTGKRESGLQYTNTGEIFEIESIPVKDDSGRIVRVVSITKDSPEVNQLRKSLEESKELLVNFQKEVARIQQEKYEEKSFIYKSKQIEELFELVKSVASVDASVLILGETGVGKQMVANQIHVLSDRNEKPFVTINCGAIPENLLESELFGYEEGAFSGTRKGGKLGLFEIADKGTLLLDEIGEMPLSLQVKLLRVLQEKVILRVGGTKEKKVDVRILAATNKNLLQMIKEGAFREDLYYRINVVPIQIPPLRERKEDIQEFAFYFLNQFNQKYHKKAELLPNQIQKILSYSWPGNVRELENTIERFVVLEQLLLPEEREQKLLDLEKYSLKEGDFPNLTEYVENLEKQLLLEAISAFSTTREIAKNLQVNQSTIVRKLQKYNLKTKK